MKAILLTRYGSPDNLKLAEVQKPAPNENQILVRVCAASVNPADHHLLHMPFLVRLVMGTFMPKLGIGILKPRRPILGADIAGRVEAVGEKVTEFQIGDEVFGVCAGGFAEYAVAREDRLVLKPANVTFEAAAATPVVGFTALQGLRDTAQIQAGQEVLINGAAGGIGTFSVQYAKSVGAEVSGVCSTRNLDMVRSIGADHGIDYTREDFTRNGQQYDLIFDVIGNRSALDYRRALSSQGKCVIAGFTSFPRMFEYMILGRWLSKAGGKQIGSMGIAKSNQADLLAIQQLLETRQVVPVIDHCYPLSETAEALRHLGTRHARGKVIITVAQGQA